MSVAEPRPAEARAVYRPWVGLVVSVILPGATQFLRGQRRLGLVWALGLVALNLVAVVALPFPGSWPMAIALTFGVAALSAWGRLMILSWRPLPRMSARQWMLFGVIALLANSSVDLMVSSAVTTFRVVPTASMAPTLQTDDNVVVERVTPRSRAPQRGDIVAFRASAVPRMSDRNAFFMMRVAGLPGERVRIDPPELLINDVPVREPAFFAAQAEARLRGFEGFQFARSSNVTTILGSASDELELGPDEYFVLADDVGDETRSAFDSRFWGALPSTAIVGRVTRIYWPLSRAGVTLIP